MVECFSLLQLHEFVTSSNARSLSAWWDASFFYFLSFLPRFQFGQRWSKLILLSIYSFYLRFLLSGDTINRALYCPYFTTFQQGSHNLLDFQGVLENIQKCTETLPQQCRILKKILGKAFSCGGYEGCMSWFIRISNLPNLQMWKQNMIHKCPWNLFEMSWNFISHMLWEPCFNSPLSPRLVSKTSASPIKTKQQWTDELWLTSTNTFLLSGKFQWNPPPLLVTLVLCSI